MKTFGENTKGVLAYGDWREVAIPNLSAWISITQKKMIFYDDSNLEMIGVEPDVKLNPEEEEKWVDIVKEEIEKS